MSKFDSILEKYLTEAGGSIVSVNTETAARDATKLKGTQLGNALEKLSAAQEQGLTDPNSIKDPADIMHGVLKDDKVNPLTWDKVSDQDKSKVLLALVNKKIISPEQAQVGTTPEEKKSEEKKPSIESSTSSKTSTNYGSTQGGTLQGV